MHLNFHVTITELKWDLIIFGPGLTGSASLQGLQELLWAFLRLLDNIGPPSSAQPPALCARWAGS